MRELRRIAIFLFCAIPGLFGTVFGPVLVLLEVIHPHDPDLLPFGVAATILGVPFLLIGLGTWKRWPYVLLFAAIPWVLFGFAELTNDEMAAALLTAAVAFGGAAFIRRVVQREKSKESY